MPDEEKKSDAYSKFAKNLEEIESQEKQKKKEVLKKGVLDLEQKYKDEIKGTHVVDERLVKLRKEAGMPELIGVGEKVQRSRFKDKEKFDQFLTKEVLEVGIIESKDKGGILTFLDFCKTFAEKRPNWETNQKDLKKALENLAAARLIPKLHKMKNNEILITFKPVEFESDLLRILNIASIQGSTTIDEIIKILGWQKERIELAFKTLVEEEIAHYDKKENRYFFPGLKH